MNVLHVDTERGWRGGQRQAFLLARELKARGHGTWMACRPGRPLEKACREAGIATVPVSPWTEFGLFSARELRRAAIENRVEVVHAHSGHAVGLGALAARGAGARLVATRRVDFPLRRNALTRWKYGRVDRLVAISEAIRGVAAAGGFPAEKIRLVPSGIDAAGYPTAADRGRLRGAKGYAAGDRLIVHAGALVPHKDQATLLAAAAEVFRDLPSARLLILGEGELEPALRRQAEALGIAAQVQFLGHRADVLDYIALANVFVLSSVEEGLGTSLLDALAVGVPTVATRAGGIPDIYGGPDAPELVPPRDPARLAAALVRVLSDEEEARARVLRGRERVAKFTAASMAESYERIYEELK